MFRDLTVHHFPRNRFIFKKVAEHRPTGVIHRFCHVRFCQLGTTHIPHNNQLAILRQPMRFLVQKILAPIRNLGLQIPGLPRTFLALMFSNPSLLIPIPTRRFNFRTVRTGRQRLQPQINPDLMGSGTDFFFRDFANEIDVPTLAGVLAKAPTLDRAGEVTAVPEPEGVTGIAHSIVNHLHPGRLERNPARRPLPAPAQPPLLALLSTSLVLLAHGLHRLRMQTQFFATARGQLAQILIRRPALIPAQRVFLRFVAEVPNLITRPRQDREFGGATGILDSVLKGLYHVADDALSRNRKQHESAIRKCAAHENFRRSQSATSYSRAARQSNACQLCRNGPARTHPAKRRRTSFAALSIPALKNGAFRANPGKNMYWTNGLYLGNNTYTAALKGGADVR